MRPLFILRPEPAASRTAARAEAMGIETKLVPLFSIVPLAWSAPDPKQFDGLVLTSANAVRHGGDELDRLKSLPVHAVGEATASLARAAGFDVVSVGRGGSSDMGLPEGKSLLHLTGAAHVNTGAGTVIPVYEARPIDEPVGIEQVRDCVVAVHSPRGGQRLAALAGDRATIAIAAISQAAADACGTGWWSIEAAPVPSDNALLALAARLCESRDA